MPTLPMRPVAVTNPVTRGNAQAGRITRFIFKNDRVAGARDAGVRATNPGNATRCRAAMVTRGSGNTQAMRSRRCGDRRPAFFPIPAFRLRRDRTGGASPTEIPT